MSMIAKDLGTELKELREKKGLSLREVNKLTGISYSHLNMIENNKRNVTPALLRNLANVYNVNYLDLYVLAGYMELVEDTIERNKIEDIEISKQYYMTPVYGKISAGQPNWAEECIEGRIPIDPELMNIINPEECFFLRVNGESMNQLIKNGAFALIRKTDIVKNGEVAVVLVNGFDATLKKFSKQGEFVVLEPMSDDASFTTQVYGKDTDIKILGKYVGKMEMK